MSVNTGRVMLGGLLAGLVLNIGEFVFADFYSRSTDEDLACGAQFC